MYALMRELVDEHHREITRARIALAWCTSWKADIDGRVTLGKCVKATDLQRELHEYDYVILLSRLFWKSELTTDVQRKALLDHELTHCSVRYDGAGEMMRDERDRILWRIRKHDIEEFSDIVARYGTYKKDLEHFFTALRRGALQPFVACDVCKAGDAPGWVWTTDNKGTKRRQRCACWENWRERRSDAGGAEAAAGGTK